MALRKPWRNKMRSTGEPITRADSTKGSAFRRTTSARITRKYWGTKTTVIEPAVAKMPPQKLERPPLMEIARTMAISSEGKA